jgi:hypothetical protein
MQQVVHATGLEEANTLLRAELEAARTKLAEVEHRERTLTSENEGLKRDLEGAHSAGSCNEGKRVGAAS